MRINELTRRDLVSDVDSVTKQRSRQIQGSPTYQGMTRDYVIKMKVNSATGSGDYTVSIKLVELPSLLPEENMDTREKIRLAIDGDLKINCTCPAFRYFGFEYITTQLNSIEGEPQERYPEVRNPRLVGIMCKHCFKAVKSFGSYWSRLASDIDKERYLE